MKTAAAKNRQPKKPSSKRDSVLVIGLLVAAAAWHAAIATYCTPRPRCSMKSGVFATSLDSHPPSSHHHHHKRRRQAPPSRTRRRYSQSTAERDENLPCRGWLASSRRCQQKRATPMQGVRITLPKKPTSIARDEATRAVWPHQGPTIGAFHTRANKASKRQRGLAQIGPRELLAAL